GTEEQSAGRGPSPARGRDRDQGLRRGVAADRRRGERCGAPASRGGSPAAVTSRAGPVPVIRPPRERKSTEIADRVPNRAVVSSGQLRFERFHRPGSPNDRLVVV